MAQIIPIVSEALQSTIRRLLPSQNGFGEDLQAQNVIVPIIDLTPSAEGSSIPESMQTALNLGGSTAFAISGAATTIASNAGFHRVLGSICLPRDSASNLTAFFSITDGLTSKNVYGIEFQLGVDAGAVAIPFEFTVYLNSGDSLVGTSNSGKVHIVGSSRQIATSTGELVNPVGFVVQ